MRIAIHGKGASETAIRQVRDALDDTGISVCPPHRKIKDIDCMVVLGGDKGVRSYFHGTADPNIPILGLGEAESGGFLAQIDYRELHAYAGRLRGGDYTVEEVPRLGVRLDGGSVYPVLNDVAVFPSRSAILMEHTLQVNGEEVWHDSSDGVIVSTPAGSSAYSMSAGGPVIFAESKVFGIISVNSLDVTRRPLIVPDSSAIKIDDIYSRLHCEAILDGIDRCNVKKSVDCTEFAPPARIIRMKGGSTAASVLARKVRLAEELLSMPPSSKLLLKTLEYEGGSLTQKELASKTLLPDRTVRLALSHLLEKGYVKRKVSIRDARQKIYEISRLG